jgi:hypothetical protein
VRRLRDSASWIGLALLATGDPEIGCLPMECIVGRPFGLRRVRSPCPVPRGTFAERSATSRALVRQVALRSPQREVFDAVSLFCDGAHGNAARRSQLLSQDGNHLTLAGSRMLAGALASQVLLITVAQADG